jgi:uncharacterized membrane protein
MNKSLLSLVLGLILFHPLFAFAQDGNLIQDTVTIVKAKVLEVEKQELKTVPGTDVKSNYQTIQVQILEGDDSGKVVTVYNDYLSLEKGETFYLMKTVRGEDKSVVYAVSEPYRLPAIMFFIALFIILAIIFGGIQGIRGLLSFAISLFVILYLLLPGILNGYSPIFLSLGASSLIVILGSYITHGFNKTTTSAVIGMVVTLIITGILGYFAVHYARLSGFASEESTYLNIDTRGSIDFVGLLFGGIIIGLLGVLYDVAIGQAISVEELHKVASHLPKGVIYKRAIRIGREHIGALINTLAIAYVGVSLPLLLIYLKSSTSPLALIINREIFATEIIRTMIGSIGLVLAVPITTIISVYLLVKVKNNHANKEELKREEEMIEHAGHHH